MLWYKGWLETRFRLLFTLGFIAFFMVTVQHSAQNSAASVPHASAAVLNAATFGNAILLLMIYAMLAGAGIVTQPSFQAAKGIHGSTLFTLSLPVSRLRLLAVRAAIGWLEGAAEVAILCCGMWFLSPLIRRMATPTEMAEYAATLIVCGSALYFLSVLLATFLDDQWRVWGTMIAGAALFWLSRHVSLPASIDIVQAIGKGSPLIAHAIPWAAMDFSLALAAIFFFAALKVVQTREY